ncbi:MAG: trypsin-like serine protease [Myxococcales bacterium]|nr:trypsin-like serine protease [Myxococcales bacterium]MCB9702813.1 trypsin-like serine protease [Myxococcales bacterium]
MRPLLPLVCASFASFFLFSPSAAADEPLAFSIDLTPDGIYGGTEVATCGWPTTVSLEGACTGTLVHPEVVIYAAHCGTGYNQIRLGESVQGGVGRTVKTAWCKTYPGGGPGNGNDFAVCKLAEPVTDVQLVPILMGCETDILKPGTEVTIVGFGNADNGPYGIKREVTTTINQITGKNEAFIGGGGKDSCQGDSGGPVFVKLDKGKYGAPADDTWRVFGITSYGGACGTGGYYSMMHNGIGWIEQETGIDVTPCHDALGNWQPTGECGFFPLDPGAGGGVWTSSCEPSPTSESLSSMCGAPAAPDTEPPTVAILDPGDGTEYPGPTQDMTIVVDAQDVGWGIKGVQLILNGDEVDGGLDLSPPYEFKVSMPTGQWIFGAKAIDLGGNEAYADEVGVGVGKPAPMPDGGTGGTDGSGTGGTGGGTGGTDGGTGGGGETSGGGGGTAGSATGASSATGATAGSDSATGGQDDTEIGCTCTTSPSGGGFALVGLFALVGFRRRR